LGVQAAVVVATEVRVALLLMAAAKVAALAEMLPLMLVQ
tara:strand:+ start:291 stop:407 length:117 start_codon:yes stop_codon:yes gene_type:complete